MDGSLAILRPFFKVFQSYQDNDWLIKIKEPGRVAQSIARLTQEPEIPGSTPGTVRPHSFVFLPPIREGSCQLLAKVCALNTGQPLRRSKPAQE